MARMHVRRAVNVAWTGFPANNEPTNLKFKFETQLYDSFMSSVFYLFFVRMDRPE